MPLHYAAAEDLAKVLQPYVGDGGKIVADPGHNALLIGGEPQARESLHRSGAGIRYRTSSHGSPMRLLPVSTAT